MPDLVVEHRESQFSHRLRRRRAQIVVGIAVVEAVLVLVGIVPWWAAVVAATVPLPHTRGLPAGRCPRVCARPRGSQPSPS